MIHSWIRSAIVLLALTAVLHGQDRAKRDSIVDAVNALPGWTAAGNTARFNESNLDKFDKTLASGLRTYGISNIADQIWHSPVGRVRAEMFQFMDSPSAYGYFSIRRKATGKSLTAFEAGVEGFRSGDSCYFWQAQYVVRLEGDSRTMEGAAKTLSEVILGRSERPPLVNHLPTLNLLAGSEEYLLDPADVQKVEGIESSALGFDNSAEAAAADYRVNGKDARLLLILYPTQQMAKKYADQFNAATPKLSASRKRIGPLVAIVSRTSDAPVVQALLDQVRYQSKVTWSEPQPGLGLGPIIVTVFTFIAILLGVCIFVGISLGGIRIVMKVLYPNRVFARQETAGMVQLKLGQELTRKELGKQ